MNVVLFTLFLKSELSYLVKLVGGIPIDIVVFLRKFLDTICELISVVSNLNNGIESFNAYI